ncbi:hypothetical protein [Desulfobulbus oligotrophicus]|uniref:Uncharacterized protein n=1 Tax=Desulfobulbus oligotrophicus TaxID=1909699 RepID=A0A7T5VB47_9BACT|nr:hypothetical protein [Desulfobulbus oligotrophicus]QQG64650.1 hypothetical protein HP555_01630 [Desulfobulbus oligotrophicus]
MIFEYALEPEMVAAWGDRVNHRYFIREFGSGQGRLVSRYPKKWARKVWDACAGGSDMDKARLTELLVRLQETMIKRKDYVWDEGATWLDNAGQEHARHPFRAVLAHNNPAGRPEILCEDGLAASPCPGWDNPHGITVNRKASEMVAAVRQMLTCCQWVKFIDPHLWPGESRYNNSLRAFMMVLAGPRPIVPPESIEIHTKRIDVEDHIILKRFQEVIPNALQVSLYQWQERPRGQGLHNRYILTDLGGVSFHHGLDTGADGETDDLTRLDMDQYLFRCKQYDPAAPAFDQAADPLKITGTLGR